MFLQIFIMPRVKLFDTEIVLSKAMDLFWKQGYSATSVQDLVSHLGINRASLYDTYGDKEKLFKMAFNHYRATNIEEMNQFFQRETVVKEGLKKLFEMAIDESIEDKDRKGCFVVNTTTELIPGDNEILDVLKENKRCFEELFYNYLLRGEKEGQFKKNKDLKSIASLLYMTYNGLKVVSKIEPNKTELVNSIGVVLSLLD